MNEKLRDFLIKLKLFWRKARYAIVPLVTLLCLYQAGVALTLLPQFESVQYVLSKKLDREVDAFAVYLNNEYYGTMESESGIQKVWGSAIKRIITETGVQYKIDATYKLQDTASRSSQMTPDGDMEQMFYDYLKGQIQYYSFVGYAVHIDESIFVLRSEGDVLKFFELLGQDAVDSSQYLVHCVSFTNGEPDYQIIPLTEDGELDEEGLISFSGASISTTVEKGSVPDSNTLLNSFVGVYISGEKGYQTVYVREADVLTAEQAYQMCISPTIYETDYTIQKGDTIKSVVKKFGMTNDQFFALNSTYTSNSSLVAGRTLRVYSTEKRVSSYQVYRSVSKSSFAASVNYTYDSTKESTYSVVTNPGSAGLAIIDEFIFYVNGQVSSTTRIGEVIIQNAVAKEVTVGSKATPKFIWPTEGNISQVFGVKGPQYTLKEGHSGIDLVNVPGTYIHAAASGEVIIADKNASHGWSITISHGNDYFTEYSHCSSLLVSVGDYVEQGQVIALMGSTGYLSTGTHLHFAIANCASGDWDYFDPLRYLPKR